MTTLKRPDTGQLSDFVAVARGYVCLRLADTVTPAVRWFPMAAIEAVNPVYTCAEPPKPLTVVLTPELAANVNASALVSIVVRERVTLWHPGMAA